MKDKVGALFEFVAHPIFRYYSFYLKHSPFHPARDMSIGWSINLDYLCLGITYHLTWR